MAQIDSILSIKFEVLTFRKGIKKFGCKSDKLGRYFNKHFGTITISPVSLDTKKLKGNNDRTYF